MEDEQTEWMDEQPDRSPEILPSPTFQEMWSQMAAAFGQSVETIKNAFEPVFKAYSNHSWNSTEYCLSSEVEKLTNEERYNELMRKKKNSNHGPRSGDKYNLYGKRKW